MGVSVSPATLGALLLTIAGFTMRTSSQAPQYRSQPHPQPGVFPHSGTNQLEVTDEGK